MHAGICSLRLSCPFVMGSSVADRLTRSPVFNILCFSEEIHFNRDLQSPDTNIQHLSTKALYNQSGGASGLCGFLLSKIHSSALAEDVIGGALFV